MLRPRNLTNKGNARKNYQYKNNSALTFTLSYAVNQIVLIQETNRTAHNVNARMHPKIGLAKIRHLLKFCGKTCRFYFKQQTAKHITFMCSKYERIETYD